MVGVVCYVPWYLEPGSKGVFSEVDIVGHVDPKDVGTVYTVSVPMDKVKIIEEAAGLSKGLLECRRVAQLGPLESSPGPYASSSECQVEIPTLYGSTRLWVREKDLLGVI